MSEAKLDQAGQRLADDLNVDFQHGKAAMQSILDDLSDEERATWRDAADRAEALRAAGQADPAYAGTPIVVAYESVPGSDLRSRIRDMEYFAVTSQDRIIGELSTHMRGEGVDVTDAERRQCDLAESDAAQRLADRVDACALAAGVTSLDELRYERAWRDRPETPEPLNAWRFDEPMPETRFTRVMAWLDRWCMPVVHGATIASGVGIVLYCIWLFIVRPLSW